MNIFKLISLSLLLIIIFASCSASESLTKDGADTEGASIYPSWYNSSMFEADSTSYSGYATAIASDSLTAIKRARAAARVNLEKEIGNITEEIRIALEENGSEQVGNTDFIIILRTAHSKVGDSADYGNILVDKMDGHFRGFAGVTISKTEVANILEEGFVGHPRYWAEFSGADLFSTYFN